jgi:sulfur carrier protein ThiS
MQVVVLYECKKKKVKLKQGSSICDAIAALDANPQTLIVKLNGKIAHEKSKLRDGDKIELIGIIYGG